MHLFWKLTLITEETTPLKIGWFYAGMIFGIIGMPEHQA